MGPNLYGERPGAVLEICGSPDELLALTEGWVAAVQRLFRALDLGEAVTHSRSSISGASLFVASPVEVLMTATEISEQAWALAESEVDATGALVSRLRGLAAEERASRPNLARAYDAAIERGVLVTFDDELLTIGSGEGSVSWPLADVPPVEAIPWASIRDVPIALVTGSNGKTTTTRLIAAMWRATGRSAGWSCSDGVWVDAEQLDAGDYSGPAGARVVLRDRRVQAAVLETARGGVLRRGLAPSRADVAIITNVSADHFGEYGVTSIEELAEVKSVVARPLGPTGCLVLNAGDARLVALAQRLSCRIAWFSAAAENTTLGAHVTRGGDAALVEGGRVIVWCSGSRHDLGGVSAMPLTLGGSAAHNVENILGAALAGAVAGAPVEAIRETLAHFGESPEDNPGRLQSYRFGGMTVLVDYAHNPGGLEVLCETARAFPAVRRLLLLGQAGNRDDDQLRALARVVLGVLPFDHVIIKEMPTMLRGRQAYDVPRVLADELAGLGVPGERIEIIEGETAAVRRALEWSRDGDLLVLPVHVDKQAVLALLSALTSSGWTPGADFSHILPS